jgi:hypothetical protein
VPFLRPEEYRELSSRTFWSKDELLFLFMAALKNQAVGCAVLKLGTNPPTPMHISYVTPLRYSRYTSPLLLEAFCRQALLFNGDCYAPVRAEREEDTPEADDYDDPTTPADPFG